MIIICMPMRGMRRGAGGKSGRGGDLEGFQSILDWYLQDYN